MKVTLTEKLDVAVSEQPFEVWFKFNKKRGVDSDYWFTPTGKCNIYIGACNLDHKGKLGEGQYDKLMAQMKKAKCDVLTDGINYYTTGDNNLIQINNMYRILKNANEEWEIRFKEL